MRYALAAALLALSLTARAADPVELKKATWKVGSETREALVHNPPGSKKPVVFVWHGHGGTHNFAARKFTTHKLWPEAVVVYAQGLPTPAPMVDPEGKRSGWQKFVGDQDDRDLKLFDAMLQTCLAEYGGDPARVFSAGHSNGGYFTYLLAGVRPGKLAAIAPVAGTLTLRIARDVKPIPVLHVAGEKDPLVKYDSQLRTIERMKEVNGCDKNGMPSGKHCTEYPSKGGHPVVAFLHPGGHEVPDGAAERIAEFFKAVGKK